MLNGNGRDALISCCRSPELAASLFVMERAFWNSQRGCFHLISGRRKVWKRPESWGEPDMASGSLMAGWKRANSAVKLVRHGRVHPYGRGHKREDHWHA